MGLPCALVQSFYAIAARIQQKLSYENHQLIETQFILCCAETSACQLDLGTMAS